MFRTHHSGWNSSTKHKNLRWKKHLENPTIVTKPFFFNEQPDLCAYLGYIFPGSISPPAKNSHVGHRWIDGLDGLGPGDQKTNSTQEIFNPKKKPWNMFFFSHAKCVASTQNCNCGKKIGTHSFLCVSFWDTLVNYIITTLTPKDAEG